MEKKTRRKLSRREFIKTGAAGLGVAALGSLPQKAFGAAPAVIKGTKLSLLQASYFIAPAQDLFRKQVEEFGKMAGVTMAVDFLNWPDLQPKIAAAVQAGGLDLVDLWPGWNFLYRNSLVDLSKEAEEVGKRGGGYEPYVLNSGKVGGKWLGIPNGYSNASMAYRISLFKEAEVANAEDGNKIDLTWDQYFAIAKRLKAKGSKKMRIWSAACSTGEEPYTLSMMVSDKLSDPEYKDWDIEIHGSDISEAVLCSARRGEYNDYSVRNVTPKHLNKYFMKTESGKYAVKAEIKKMVRLSNINLADDATLRMYRGMDIIFCRNVLIYFDEVSKKKVIANLYNSLVSGGYLFIGHSESLFNITRAFKIIDVNSVLIYQK